MSVHSKVTLADISAAAGVSRATASMILSGRGDVSFASATIRKVRTAAADLGYVSTTRKKACMLLSAKSVLIICPNIINLYYSSIVQAIQQAAAQKNYSTVITTTYRDAQSEAAILHMAAESHLAGIIFTMMPQSTQLVERINAICPVVVIGDRNASLNVDTVELDNYSAGVLIARHMIELGHKHIAYISTTLNDSNSARVRRLEGVQHTYATGCPQGTVLVKSTDISPEQELNDLSIEHRVGYELTMATLPNKKITAFIAVNDMVAYGVLNAISAAGYSVPHDYSVCGFDNLFPSQFPPLGLTTVEHYIVDKGRNAFEILHNKITHASSDRNITRVEFKHHLIVRGSTATPRSSVAHAGKVPTT